MKRIESRFLSWTLEFEEEVLEGKWTCWRGLKPAFVSLQNSGFHFLKTAYLFSKPLSIRQCLKLFDPFRYRKSVPCCKEYSIHKLFTHVSVHLGVNILHWLRWVLVFCLLRSSLTIPQGYRALRKWCPEMLVVLFSKKPNDAKFTS